MFDLSKRTNRDDHADFMRLTQGQLFALFKCVGGKFGVKRVLQTAGKIDEVALIIGAPDATITCKVGSSVCFGFYKVLERYTNNEVKYNDKEFEVWAEEVLADDSLKEITVELSVAGMSELTGVDTSQGRVEMYSHELYRAMRYPYMPIPPELVPQIVVQMNRKEKKDRDCFNKSQTLTAPFFWEGQRRTHEVGIEHCWSDFGVTPLEVFIGRWQQTNDTGAEIPFLSDEANSKFVVMRSGRDYRF